MIRFLSAAGVVGCGAHAAAGPAVVVERAPPCPVVFSASASVSASAAAPVKAAPLTVPAAQQRDHVLVEAFDCFSTFEEKRTESLRAWASGGPDGAAWNVEGAPLRCELVLSAPCAGAAALRALGNTKLLAKHQAGLVAGKNTLEVVLPAAAWEKALEASPGPYSVLLISVSGFLSCATDAGGERFHFVDAFLAGFSGGE